MNTQTEKRKIARPDRPGHIELGRGGSRPHYPCTANEVILEGVTTPLIPPHELYFKENKHGHADLTRHEAVFSEFWYMMIGKERTPKPYIAVNPQNHDEIAGLVTVKLNFKSFKRHPHYKRWDRFNKKHIAQVLGMIERAQEDDTHGDNIGIMGYDLAKISELNGNLNDARDDKIYLGRLGEYYVRGADGVLNRGSFAALGLNLNEMDSLFQIPARGNESPKEWDEKLAKWEKNRLHWEDTITRFALEQGHAEYKLAIIDHDMSFYDVIYSRFGSGKRFFFHPFGSQRHHLTPSEITSFPQVSEYEPHYWPGKSKPLISKLFGKPHKNYTEEDKNFLTGLANDPVYNKEKFYMMLKFLLIPEALLREMIRQHLREDSPLLPLDLNAFIELQAEKMACTVASTAFRQAVLDNADEYRARFVEEMKTYITDIASDLPIDMASVFNTFKTQCDSYDPTDTPLHVAIRSGKFRFDETMRWYRNDLNTLNTAGNSPVELAIELGLAVDENDPLRHHKLEYFKQTTQFLIEQGATRPANYNTLLQRRAPAGQMSLHDKIQDKLTHREIVLDDISHFTEPEYREVLAETLCKRKNSKVQIALIENYNRNQSPAEIQQTPMKTLMLDALETALKTLRDDTSITLKMKKNAAILAFQTILPHLNTGDDFRRIESILDNQENRFLTQLTSRFEIIRRIRGLYGVTSTYKTIVQAINERMSECEKTLDDTNDTTDTKQKITEVFQTLSEKNQGFFARHMSLVQVKSLEEREAQELSRSAPAA